MLEVEFESRSLIGSKTSDSSCRGSSPVLGATAATPWPAVQEMYVKAEGFNWQVGALCRLLVWKKAQVLF